MYVKNKYEKNTKLIRKKINYKKKIKIIRIVYNINIKVSGGFLIGVNHKVFKTLTFFFLI